MLYWFKNPKLAACVLCGLVIIAWIVTLAITGLNRLRPARLSTVEHRVSGGSMAEVLVGTHYAVTCSDCNLPFRVDADDPPIDDLAVCPNCGQTSNPLGNLVPGDVVSVDTSTYRTDLPRRWDLAALNTDDKKRQQIVKRIVGLPGEQIEIRAGDIFVNGEILRKSIEELRRLVILVHDDRFRPSSQQQQSPRWRPANAAESNWRADGLQYLRTGPRRAGRTPDGDSLDWLVYHHWPCMPSLTSTRADAPVKDNYGYNQGLSRKLHLVTDLMLSCRVAFRDWQLLSLRIDNGRDQFTVDLRREDQAIQLRRETAIVMSAELRADRQSDIEVARVELAICDQRVMLALNGDVRIEHDFQPSAGPADPTATPLAIGACAQSLAISELKVSRDIHYLDPAGIAVPWSLEWPLAASEYLLLGDNVPISVDARHWEIPGIARKQLMGKVLEPEDTTSKNQIGTGRRQPAPPGAD